MMNVAKGLCVRLFAACLLAHLACAAADDQVEIMPVSQVRAGMKGYGLTTFEKARVDRFDVEVLGVIRYWGPYDAVLVRLSGKVLDETGLISGMSGSPVYIDGKLLGAVAFGWYFCKVPIGGVTPAEEMMGVEKLDREAVKVEVAARKTYCRQALQRKSRKLAELLASPGSEPITRGVLNRRLLELVARPLRLGARRSIPVELLPDSVRPALPVSAGSALMPLPLPLAMTGIDGARAEAFFPLLSNEGFSPVQAGATVVGETEEPKLTPGAALGAVFVSGDMDVSAMGTVTSVVGKRVLAFGHSMLGSGQVDVPMALGRVHAVVPRLQNSFRLSSAGRIIGRITQDREAAIVGRLGESSGMFPCKVNVRGVTEESYNFNIADYWELCPLMTSMAISASVARWEGMGNPYTLTAKAQIRLKGHEKPILLRNVYVSLSPEEPAATLVGLPLQALMLNPFEDVKIESVAFEMNVKEGFDSATIESVAVSRRELRPGDSLSLYVKLRKFRGEEVVKKLHLEIPRDAQPGTRADIMVCDAQSSYALRLGRDPGFFAPVDFEKLLDALRFVEQNTNLFVHASFLRRGVRYEGEAMPDLPPSALNMLRFSHEAGKVAPLVQDVKLAIETPWVIEGARRISVLIREPERGVRVPH